MDTFKKEILEELISENPVPKVSIYLNTHKSGKEQRKNHKKLKNQISKAADLLENRGLRKTEVKKIIEPADRLINDTIFWRYQSDGLALFFSPDTYLKFRLPVKFKNNTYVSDRYYLKPLIDFLSNDRSFYILALSKNENRLLQCTKQAISRIEPENVPESLSEALWYDDYESQLQFKTRSPQVKHGQRSGIHHGHGIPDQYEENVVKRYFSKIDRALGKFFGTERAPLVIAAVAYLHPLYKEVNTYNHLLTDGVNGNPESLNDKELKGMAWDIVKPYFNKEKEKLLKTYGDLKSQDKSSDRLEEIVNAAYRGKVEVLFSTSGKNYWGVYNQNTGTVYSHSKQKHESIDLSDLAAVKTIAHDGRFYSLPSKVVPSDTGMAAILRP